MPKLTYKTKEEITRSANRHVARTLSELEEEYDYIDEYIKEVFRENMHYAAQDGARIAAKNMNQKSMKDEKQTARNV